MTGHRGCSVPRTDLLADGAPSSPALWGRGVITAQARGTELNGNGNSMWEPPGSAVQVISCSFNGGLKTTEPSPFEICEILLLNWVLVLQTAFRFQHHTEKEDESTLLLRLKVFNHFSRIQIRLKQKLF